MYNTSYGLKKLKPKTKKKNQINTRYELWNDIEVIQLKLWISLDHLRIY